MPPILRGDQTSGPASFKPQRNYDYEYPEGLDLRPGSELHDFLRDKVMDRANYSARIMTTRHSDWQKIDHTLTAYIPADDYEKSLKDSDERKPVSVVFPNSYTVLETLLSYFVGAFIQEPIFRYEGHGPEDVIGAILLEKVIQQQVLKNKVGLNLHTQARDAFAYGFGVSTPVWTEEWGKKRVKKEVPRMFGLGTRIEYEVQDEQLLYEGNALDNIDPYLYLPDVTVGIHEPQKGEYVGWVEHTNYMNLLAHESETGDLYNVKYLRELKGRSCSVYPMDSSGRGTKSGINKDSINNTSPDTDSNSMNVIKMFIKIIPKDWDIGDKDTPEMWYFEVGQEAVILKAEPAGLDHNKFPVNVMVPDFDGYSVTPISRIEILYGLQGVLDFLFNSHIANVRKAINDMIIYDPYQVNSNDLKNPEPGKLIRLRRPAWGRGVKDVVSQLNVQDITQANIGDSSWIVQWMERISGADASMQGSLRQGGPERLTGMEFQGTRAGGISRLERLVKIMGMQGMQDIGTLFALHNQQMMTKETYIKITGDWQDVLMKEYAKDMDRGRINVTPDDLNIAYDVLVRDGSIPGGNFAREWIQLYQIIAGNPEIAQQFDVVRIFTHIARNLGAKNVNDFVRKGGSIDASIMPDENVRHEFVHGNIVPIDKMPAQQAMGGV
jgi:hypothetical protein